MPRSELEGVVTLSAFDRMIDHEPKNRNEAPMTRAQSLRELKASLRRDLEWLLNTRRTPLPAEESGETGRSVYNFGLPDLSSMTLNSSHDQNRLCRMIEHALNTFEPRLTSVQVKLMPVQTTGRVLRFSIDALLRIDPAPEHVTFDTTLDMTSGDYTVRGETNGR